MILKYFISLKQLFFYDIRKPKIFLSRLAYLKLKYKRLSFLISILCKIYYSLITVIKTFISLKQLFFYDIRKPKIFLSRLAYLKLKYKRLSFLILVQYKIYSYVYIFIKKNKLFIKKFILVSINILSFHFIIYLINKYLFKFYNYYLSKKYTDIIFDKYKDIKYQNLKKIKKKEINYELSIVLPCYSRSKNHPEFLDLALKKILSSISLTKLQYEICIFDNASEFSIVEVLEKYKNLNIKYKKSILKHKPNDSWFNAVKMSSGNYIHIHSMDDEVDDNFYIVLEKYIKNNKIDLLYTTAKNLNNHDYDKAFTDWKYNWPSNYSCYFNPNKNNSFIKHPMPSSSWIVRREFYENHGIFENWNLGMDLDLSYRLQKYSKISYFCKEAFLYYRSHENSGNNLDNPKLKKEFIWNLQKIKFIFKYKDLSEINKKKIIFEYINNYFLIHYFLNQIKHHIQYYKNQKINLLDKKNREQVIKSNNFIYFVKKKVFKNSLLFFYLYYFLQKLMFSSAIYNIKKYDFSVNNNFIIKLSFVIWSFIYLFYSIF